MNRYFFDSVHEERRLFEAVEKVGEGQFTKVHIIMSEDGTFGNTEFRVYHSDGYCWDVRKEMQYSDESDAEGNDIEIEPHYAFYEDWDGFKKSGIELAIDAIESIEV